MATLRPTTLQPREESGRDDSPAAVSRSRFRPDVQGLRAVAVLTVIVGHAGFSLTPGGFVGVDVFFVISGFLITQLLLADRVRHGRPSLRTFYARRARRILPAATVVLVATIAASTYLLGFLRSPRDNIDALWAALFVANVRFIETGTDYFAQSLPPSPVQHFWSLAVEEQFYLLWPLVVVLLSAWRFGLRGLLWALSAITLASLVWSVVDTRLNPTSAYFSSLTRAWELGVGALVAVGASYVAHRRSGSNAAEPQRRRVLREVASGVGLLLILWACVQFTDASPFPGYRAAAPVLGAALILAVGVTDDPATLVSRALSWRPAQVIGNWSYSLYLWHWPLLVIAAERRQRDLHLSETLVVIAVTFLLAWATFRFVETPFRDPRMWRRSWHALLLYPLSVALVAGAVLGGHVYNNHEANGGPHHPAITLPAGWRAKASDELGKQRAVALVRASIKAARHHQPVPSDLRPSVTGLDASVADLGDCDYETNTRQLCPRGDPNGTKTLVLIGNSHGRHWIPAIDRIAAAAGYRAYYLVKVQCVASLVTPDLGTSSEPFTDCADFHTWMLQQEADLHPDLTIVSTSPISRGVYDPQGNYYTDSDADPVVKAGYERLFEALAPLTKRLVLLKDIPYVNRDPGGCLSVGSPDLGDCLFKQRAARTQPIQDQADAAKAEGVEAIDTAQWFCWRSACPAVVGDMITYRDSGHMTNEYSASLAGPLAAALGLRVSLPDAPP